MVATSVPSPESRTDCKGLSAGTPPRSPAQFKKQKSWRQRRSSQCFQGLGRSLYPVSIVPQNRFRCPRSRFFYFEMCWRLRTSKVPLEKSEFRKFPSEIGGHVVRKA